MTTVVETLGIDQEQIAAFCRRRHIQWLAVYGSVLRDDFRPESDVDVLVEFEPGRTPGLAFFDLPDELSSLFGGHQIDLGTKRSLNRWIRNRVLAEAEVLYDATR
ncbi:MAG: nucleotidyltransferase family protein [Thermomicrobiales bacterium]